MLPKYAEDNFPKIRELVQGLEVIAKRNDSTSAQVALAWLLAQGSDVIPIPGTKSIQRLDENMRSASLCLSEAELKEIRALIDRTEIPGTRYPAM